MTRAFSALVVAALVLIAPPVTSGGANAGDSRWSGTGAGEAGRNPVYLVALQPAAQVAQPGQRGGDGFEPVSSLPAPRREELPAAPMVMAAYAFVWVMVLGYVWSLWRRLGAVERELKAVARRVEEAGRR
jgi:CcmD family protein